MTVGFFHDDEPWCCIFENISHLRKEDVAWCIAYDRGDDGEGEFIDVILFLTNGQYAYVTGGYEITGWDVANFTITVNDTLEGLIPHLPDAAALNLLGHVRQDPT